MTVQFNLHVQGRIDGGTVIVVRGDLDYAAVDRFRTCVEQALQPPPDVLYVDVQLVTFVDSTGIGELVATRHHAERVGTRLVLENLSPTLQHALRTAGLLTSFGLPSA